MIRRSGRFTTSSLSRLARVSRGIPGILFALLLLAAPLPFGGIVRPAEWALEIAAAGILVMIALTFHSRGDLRRAFRFAAFPLAIALLGVLQSLPLPGFLSFLLGGDRLHYWRHATALLELPRGSETSPLTALSYSLAPSASRSAALDWALAGALLLAAVYVGRKRIERRVVYGALLGACVLEIVFGAERLFAGLTTTIWGVKVPYSGRLRGTFVNPNHLAALLEVGLAVTLAALWWAVHRAREHPSLEHRILIIGPWCLLWLTLFVGLAFTGSRAGMAGAALGIVVEGGLIATSHRRWRYLGIGLGAVAAGMVAAALVGFRLGFGRWLAAGSVGGRLDIEGRFALTDGALHLWARFPVLGTGLGSFRALYPLVEPRGMIGLTYWHAHNDYAELLMTVGMVGAVIVGCGVLVAILRLWKVFREGRRTEDRAAALAAFGVVAALGFHEAVAFSLTMPAVALAALAVIGGGLGARTGRRHRRHQWAEDLESGLGEADGAGDNPAAGDSSNLQAVKLVRIDVGR